MKKVLNRLVILALVMAAFSLAACDFFGGSNGGNNGGNNGDKNDKPTETVYYAVSFECNGGTEVDPIEIESGKSIPSEVFDTLKTAREGYIFEGWYSDTEFEEYFFPDAEIVRNRTLYAKWRLPKTYEILAAAAEKTRLEATGATDVIKGVRYSQVARNDEDFTQTVKMLLNEGAVSAGYSLLNSETDNTERYYSGGLFYFGTTKTPPAAEDQAAPLLYDGEAFREKDFYQTFTPLTVWFLINIINRDYKVSQTGDTITVEYTGSSLGTMFNLPELENKDIHLKYDYGNKFEFTLSQGRIISVKQSGKEENWGRTVSFVFEKDGFSLPMPEADEYTLMYQATVVEVIEKPGHFWPNIKSFFTRDTTAASLRGQIYARHWGYDYRIYADEDLTVPVSFGPEGILTLSGHQTFYCGFTEAPGDSAAAYRALELGEFSKDVGGNWGNYTASTEIVESYNKEGVLTGKDISVYNRNGEGNLIEQFYSYYGGNPHYAIDAAECWSFASWAEDITSQYYAGGDGGNWRLDSWSSRYLAIGGAAFEDTAKRFYGKSFILQDGFYVSSYEARYEEPLMAAYNESCSLKLKIQDGHVISAEFIQNVVYDADFYPDHYVKLVFTFYPEARQDLFPELPNDANAWELR